MASPGPEFARASREHALSEARLAGFDRLVREYSTSVDGLEAVPRRELRRRVRSHGVVLLDVRPPEEYAAGHIASALPLLLAQLSAEPTKGDLICNQQCGDELRHLD